MNRYCVKLLLTLFVSATTMGCAASPPVPPEELNAVFSEKAPTSLGVEEPYNTIVMASVESATKYAETRSGDWVTTWYLSKLNVHQVLTGSAPESVLHVRISDSWPTPESGIMVDKGPDYFLRPGSLFALWLDTAADLYRIAFTQLRRPENAWKNLPPEVNLKITRGVERYLDHSPAYLEYRKQTETGHIVADGATEDARGIFINSAKGKAEGITTLENLTLTDNNPLTTKVSHPLVCGSGRDFPEGTELMFGNPRLGEHVHAVFPRDTSMPKTTEKRIALTGAWHEIKNIDRYKKGGMEFLEAYRYFVVSSWEYQD